MDNFCTVYIALEETYLLLSKCMYCSQNAVESEMHVIMSCDNYMDMNVRINLFACANYVMDNITSLNIEHQFIVI